MVKGSETLPVLPGCLTCDNQLPDQPREEDHETHGRKVRGKLVYDEKKMVWIEKWSPKDYGR